MKNDECAFCEGKGQLPTNSPLEYKKCMRCLGSGINEDVFNDAIKQARENGEEIPDFLELLSWEKPSKADIRWAKKIINQLNER